MRFLLCTLLAALLLPLSVRSEILGEMQSQYREGLIWLKVDLVGKSELLNFLLDSGARISVRSIGVHLGNRQIVQGVNGQGSAYRVNDLQARMRRVSSSKIGLGCRPPRAYRPL